MSALHPADLPERVYRLGRAPDPWEWPDWSFAGDDGTFGNRYDDPDGEYRVLYASTERRTTFRECLARFRPDPAIVAAQIQGEDDDESTAPAGTVPAGWLERRRMGTARLTGGYCEVGHSDSIDVLREALAAAIVEHGVGDLDAGTLKLTAPRAFTQAVSRYVFEQTTDNGEQVFAGIVYRSKLGDELMNWAIFEDNDPYVLAVEVFEVDDEDLATVMEAFNLKFAER